MKFLGIYPSNTPIRSLGILYIISFAVNSWRLHVAISRKRLGPEGREYCNKKAYTPDMGPTIISIAVQRLQEGGRTRTHNLEIKSLTR